MPQLLSRTPAVVRTSLVRTTFMPALLAALAVPHAALAQPSTTGANGGGANADTTDPLAAEGYITPPEAIARLVTAPREMNATYATPSPGSRRWFMRLVSDGLPSLTQVGKAHHNLAGWQIDYRANRERTLTMRSSAGIEVVEWSTGRRIAVQVPAGARVGSAVWSPDGAQLAFFALFDDATQVYVADAATGASRAVSPRTVLATNVTQPQWTADGTSIVTVLVPDGRGPEPREPVLATGPMVRLNENNKLKTRTYADLLMTPYEKELVAYHMTGQVALINVRSRAVRKIGAPGLVRSVDISPDGQLLRVTYVEQPFSYVLPVSSFGTREVLLDATGKVLAEITKRPLREGEPPVTPNDPPRTAGSGAGGAAGATAAGGAGGAANRAAPVDTGRRNMAWHPTAPGLVYLQVGAAARGDSASANRRPDRVMHWKPPFDSTSAVALYETNNRITNARFNDAGTILFVTETGTGAAAGTYEQAIFLTENNARFTVIAPRRGRGDSAAPPAPAGPGGPGVGRAPAGTLVTRMGKAGGPVVMVSTDGRHVFTQSTTSDTVSIPRAYVERIEIRTGERTRLYEGTGDVVETISAPLDDDFTRAVVQRESATMVPQSFVLTLATKEAQQITNNRDLMPEMTNAIRRTVVARRADGYAFNVRVTLPADYKDGTRLPAMFWFYPREYDNQQEYTRATRQTPTQANRFPTFGARSLQFLVTQGYAVVEPDAPIFASEGQLPNDNYVVDLRNNLSAIIDALDTLAIIDRHRLGLGGHSYGAFSTVNAMVHTPFFKAGIAGDGAYNRTLTPNGFQTERRDLWQGRQTYLEMSPFLYADQLNGALLLYHSTEDQNVGTDPINSVKLYHALMGLGKNASLYMYPYEDHGPIARETVLDQWARWVAWLDKYVKGEGAGRPKAM